MNRMYVFNQIVYDSTTGIHAMKKHLVPLLIIFSFASSSFGAALVDITATKKTGQKARGDRQNVGNLSGKINSRAVYYEFNVRTVSPQVSRARAEWVVLTETLGMVMPAGHGERMLNLKLGHSTNWKSDPIDLKELEFRGLPELGSGEIETEIKGYGIRLLDGNGQLIGEEYSSTRVADQARQMLGKLSKAPSNKGKTITLEDLIKQLIEKAKNLPLPAGPPPPLKAPPKLPFP